MVAKKRTKKQIKGWNLWDDGVSQSFLYTFLACREQTRLKYIELWKSRTSSLAMEFGSCSHWIFKRCYENKLKDLSLQFVSRILKTYHNHWLKYNPIPSQKQLEKQELIYGMFKQLFPEYIKRWDGDWTGKYKYGNNTVRPQKWLDLEERYELPYKYPDGKKTFLLAVFDGIFYDRKKRLWLFESKTKSRIDEETLQDTILHDVQVMLSLWILGILKKPAGVLYNVIRRPGQKRLKDESLKIFFKRMGKDISTVKRYDHYFKRWEFAISWSEVLEWKENFLDPVMQEVRMWFEGDLPTYINPNAIANQYGRCDLYDALVKNDFSRCSQRNKYRKEK